MSPARLPKPVVHKKFRLANCSQEPEYRALCHLWHYGKNAALDDSIGTQSDTPVYLRKYCGRHYALQSFKSYLKATSMLWHNCKVCRKYQSSKLRKPAVSKEELQLYGAIEHELQLNDDEWVVDCKCVKDGSNVGAADVYIPKHELVIKIDDFLKTPGKPGSVQAEVDRRFDKHALAKYHVLRLFYKDVDQFVECLEQMSINIEDQKLQGLENAHVLFFSPSYYTLGYITESVIQMIEDSVHGVSTE